MNLEYINPKTIILELNKIIIHNKNAKDELNNLNINISWSAPEISDNRFWTGHETGNWPGIYTILINHFKNNIGSLRIVDQEIANLQQKLAIAQTARNAYAKAVNEELPEQ